MFVSLEGIDRAGKSTQAALLADALGPEALLVREPGGTPLGERLRELLKDPGSELDPRSELLLFGAARAELVERVIRPATVEGRDVVCDRFIDSTVAYQGAGRGLGTEAAEAVNEAAIAGCVPDLTVLLWLEPEQAAARGQQRLAAGESDGADRFEGEGLDFQRRISSAYAKIAADHPDRVVRVDADREVEQVHREVLAVVEQRREP